MAISGGQYALTAGAVSLTAALSLGANLACKEVIIQLKTGATVAYVGKSNVTAVPAFALAEVTPAKTVVLGPLVTNGLNTDEIFLVGTVGAGEIALITLIP